LRNLSNWNNWLKRLRRNSSTLSYVADEHPLRSELLSADQMEQHGKNLASRHQLSSERSPDLLLARLAENENVLIEICNLLTAAVEGSRRITPAAEWLLDNFYLIEEQIRTATRHLPRGYSRELPRLARGPSAGQPRVYDIALENISHGDGRIDPRNLSRFVSAYQSVSPLNLGELWAIPIMLRLALIENLRRVAVRVAAGRIDRDLADVWADRMLEIADKDPKSLILIIADMARSNPPMSTAFVSEFARRLQGQSAALALPLTWIERLLSESHLTIEQLVQMESQQQAAAQVSISNSIGSLRLLSAMDWSEFVESMSLVEKMLRTDPAEVYQGMDFATRDRYRHIVERIAKKSDLAEYQVASEAIRLAVDERIRTESVKLGAVSNSHSSIEDDRRTSHVGYYLIGDGLPLLERAAGVRKSHVSLAECLRQQEHKRSLYAYLGSIAALTLLFAGGLFARVISVDGVTADWLVVVFGIALLLSTSQLAVALTNWLATLLMAPHPLPRMDFSRGIPAESRTLVVVPTMLTSVEGIEALVEALEVRFLANQDENLYFGLLTDLKDAVAETMPEDAALIMLAEGRIAALNEKYPRRNLQGKGEEEGRQKHESSSAFFLLHRPRRWNAQECIWMGYERKRGKLADLNRFLRGGPRDCFSHVIGDTSILSSVKFVITLDTDTQLPRDAGRQFVGAMSHPLNRAVYDDAKQRVVAGYSILQPRVAVSLPGTNSSSYARLFGDEPGIDPYTRAVSDVYQDVFCEGSFIGKGIYDVDAFEMALAGRFPENRILSHDLLEGCYARSGLLSDVQLYEEYPSKYRDDMSRRHRWIRGDWQIASWMLPRVPDSTTKTYFGHQKNPLSALSQWKIIDNLRRSLVPPALTLVLILGWSVVSPAWFWTMTVIGICLIPPLISVAIDVFRKSNDVLISQHLAVIARATSAQLARLFLMIACLPYEAYVNLDAIVRTNWRMFVTKRKQLEWTPSTTPTKSNHTHHSSDGNVQTLVVSYRSMWISPAIAILETAYLVMVAPAGLITAAPFLLLWAAAPVVVWWISKPLLRRQAALTAEQVTFLQKISRKTWAFFETYVGPEDHWLPPDNFQEHPVSIVAHRTSPTNMGLALLANLTAYDFGYIPAGLLLERTENSLATMAALSRFQGHFYNWYDTVTLEPLAPLYVSAVDSGNLAGHLLTLRPGLRALADHKILNEQFREGLIATVSLLNDVTADAPPAIRGLLGQIKEDVIAFSRSATNSPESSSLIATHTWLLGLVSSVDEVNAILQDANADSPESDAKFWVHALVRQCQSALDGLTLIAPWLLLKDMPEQAVKTLNALEVPTLRELATCSCTWLSEIEQRIDSKARIAEREWLSALQASVKTSQSYAKRQMEKIEHLEKLAHELAQMSYDFLYDKTRRLLAIGYNVTDRRQDSSYYDMLGSEARLGNFVAIAQGHVPQESWFALGRLLTPTGGDPALLSWSGSMFEYLMPLLVMPTYANTLLDSTYHAVVARQIAYGGQRKVAWGISESGYNTFDAVLNYQYRAFGVPGLGLKRGLGEDLVVAPYASALALMVAPEAACANLQRLASDGLLGKFGFYEAIDYTTARLPRGQTSAVIRSFMAHHQGMTFLSLAYLLLDRPMQNRFESDPMFQATLPLLQERVPKASAFHLRIADSSSAHAGSVEPEMTVRLINTPNTPKPEVHLLSNSRYHVMITNAGGGYSRWKDIAVTRWREDATRDDSGMFCYIRDISTGAFWSNSYQPTIKKADKYEAIFSEGRAEFRRRDFDYDTHTEIAVSPEDDIELRRVRITNRARTRRTIEVTSYGEVVLTSAAADALHPAFSNLFVQTELIEGRQAIVCTRRPRSATEQAPIMFHLMAAHGGKKGAVSFETDRMQFIGRGNSTITPHAMSGTAGLSGSQGSVLDPIIAIRYQITLDSEQSTTIDMVTGIAENRDIALGLIEKYQDRRLADRVFELAWTHSQVVLRQINATDRDAQLYARLASSVVYANSPLRADANVIVKNQRAQSGLWGYAVSGDFPIVLLRIGDPENIELVRQLVKAHAYWRLKGLAVDLVIWNEDRGGYRQALQEQIMGLIAAGIEAHVIDRPGGIFVRSAEHISDEDRILFESVSRAIITDQRGELADQIGGVTELRAPYRNLPRFKPTLAHRNQLEAEIANKRDGLLFDNGIGGFSADGREYMVTTSLTQTTPAPWVNVLANPHFGSVVSESGMAYTWSENAHEYRLTPWHNDPVTDAGGEAFYVRDEETGYFWSPTPLPCRGVNQYITRHGFGYSVFEHIEGGIQSTLTVYVAMDDAIKFSVLKVGNTSGRARRLSVTGYVEWVLGDLRSKSTPHVITEIDPLSGALHARNAYNNEFADRIVFFDIDDPARTFTGDRAEFIGRNGALSNPAALSRSHLSNKVGAALDPCAAIQVPFELVDGEEREFIFRLGAGRDLADARKLAQRCRGPSTAHLALDKVRQYWARTLGAVQVETPDQSINILVNGWLTYQTLACRLWARSGYYQSGGAFGFRDQLQDVMALIHAAPMLVREHLLLSASRQFREGDVQHWWHPPAGRGVRTRCSDDYLWLPLVTCRYVAATGDTGVLDESSYFLEGRPVNPEDESYYDLPHRAEEAASLYQHCVHAILKGLTFGEHGLPLIGSGDWNDGMNLVGIHGKGESIWLGFFLCEVLGKFAVVARSYGDIGFSDRCIAERVKLSGNIEQHGWDGEWYRRAYFDDGRPLGSAGNAECQIDSISQSWSVLSGAGQVARSRKAMEAVDKRLVRREDALIQLLDPPFDKSDLHPGYIRGYVPGVRENGGQYTHGAIWAAMAFAALGDSERAWELTSMINPLNHAASAESIATYKVEPYVISADVYAVAPHVGRGGWSWYTGSAGWMYRLIVESLLGLRLEVDKLYFAPCIPADWPGFTMRYRFRETVYRIAVLQKGQAGAADDNVGSDILDGRTQVIVDGISRAEQFIPLVDDRREHFVKIEFCVAKKLPRVMLPLVQ
jgi:cyclic beta-1,2-glucan synthetase